MNALWGDIRFAARTLLKVPGFTTIIVLSIALGIAANTTVFSIVNGLFLGSLPVRDPDRLVMFSEGNTLSYPDFVDYRDQTKQVFEGVAAHFPFIPASLGGAGEPERIWGALVSGNYFSLAGVAPVLGRAILPEEDAVVGRDAVVVLSHALWRRRFAADPNVVGRAVILNGQRYTVVGVAPPGFHGTLRGVLPEFWVPLAMYAQIMPDLAKDNPYNERDSQWLILNARLRAGVTRSQAAAAVNVVKNRLDNTYHRGEQRRRAITIDKAGGLVGSSELPALSLSAVLMVVVGFVLLVACANVANLLLARATVRQKEIAIRMAMGAGRWRLLRQMLTESLLLSVLGAGVGFLMAAFAARALSRFELPLPFPIVFDFNVDERVLAFTVALSIVTALLFGLAPALRATRPDLVAALRNESGILGPFSRFGPRNGLVVIQVALSLVLLAGAGLFLRSLQNASSIELGLRPENVLLMAVDPKLHHYSRPQTQQFLAQLRERVSALPGVRSVSFLDSVPLSIGGTGFDFRAERGKDGGTQTVNADVYYVGKGFFETMGIPLLRGRDFNLASDDEHVGMINETMAQRLFADADPIGREISADKVRYTIVGVARNSKSRTLTEEPAACAYLFLEPKPENAMSFYGISIAVRTAAPPAGLARPIRNEILRLDPNMAIFSTETMEEHVNKSLLLPRICATLLGVFGGVGLALATVGLYGVTSYSVRRRTREIGIRMAIGASREQVLRMVLGQGLTLTAIGLAIGWSIALALGRFTSSLLYGISGTDYLTLVTVSAVLLGTALGAVVLPARRAASVEPSVALRYE